jgi:formylmethanofuran dehydrogenase subunit E
VGYRAAKLALGRLNFDRARASRQKVVAHNSGAAVDAIQYLTGCTLGKRNLIVYDEERHQYEFITEEGVLELTLDPSVEENLRTEAVREASGSSPAAAERIIDQVLNLSDDALFRVRWLLREPRP